MQKHLRSSQAGMSLISVLVTATIMAGVSIGFMQMFQAQMKSSRKIAAWGGVTDISHLIDLFLNSPSCANGGTFTFNGAPSVVNVTGPDAYTVSMDTLSFPSGGMAVTSLPNPNMAMMLHPYSIEAMNWVALGGSGATASGFQFPVLLRITFRSQSGPPPVPIQKPMTLVTNAARRVIGACFATEEPLSFVNADQSSTVFVPASIFYQVPFNRELQDTLNEFNPSTGVFTASRDGIYSISSAISFLPQAWTAGSYCKIIIFQNGTAINENALIQASHGNGCHSLASMSRRLAAGDRITVGAQLTQPPGGTLSGNAWQTNFQITRIR